MASSATGQTPVPSLLWHDYESFGADPLRDRPAQFACWRTNLELEPIAEPVAYLCQPAPDYLPEPEACLLTGLLPGTLAQQGLPEPEFARAVHTEFAQAGTCGVGYNSMRFDDELTRHLFWRNLLDPYQREWANGNSRWDLIDALRMAYALRPEGMEWPRRDDGAPSFKLEHLAQANQVTQHRAHDARDDVAALLGLAQRFRRAQPRLYHHAFELRHKAQAARWIRMGQPLVHVSQRIAAERGCLALMLPVARHPVIDQRIIAVDLGKADDAWLSGAPEQWAEQLVAPWREGIERPPFKLIHLNRAPMLAPLSVLQGVDLARIQLDLPACLARAERLRAVAHLAEQLRQTWRLLEAAPSERDPEQALYDGFVGEQDRHAITQMSKLDWQAALRKDVQWQDARLTCLHRRARARWLPECLNPQQALAWLAEVRARLSDEARGLLRYQSRIDELLGQGKDRATLAALTQWGRDVATRFQWSGGDTTQRGCHD